MNSRSHYLFSIIFVTISTFTATAQTDKDSVFLFSYFKGNGEDGLHLAASDDGYTWTALKDDSSFLQPVVAKDKLMRDPCIIQGPDGLFRMVWTVSWKDRGIGYASSHDLIHWSTQEFIPVMMHEPTAKNCWAPEIIYDAPSRQYMIYWATTIPGRFPATDSLGDNNHRIYYTITADFKKFTSAKILYDQGFNVIDATIQKAGSQYIMFLKDETLRPQPQKNLHLAFSKYLNKGYGPPSPAITGREWAEGPTAIYAKGKWIVYFDKYRDGHYGAIESTDLQHWTDVSDRLHFPKGIRHGTVLRIAKRQLPLAQTSATTHHNDLLQAKNIARKEHRSILLSFSGSDWCVPCIRLEKELFGSPSFKQLADTSLVLVNADFPRMKKNQLPADQQKINDALADRYNAAGKFPLTVLLDEEGNVLKEWDGVPEGAPSQFCAELAAIVNARH